MDKEKKRKSSPECGSGTEVGKEPNKQTKKRRTDPVGIFPV